MTGKVFVDTDIVFDLLAKRDPFYLAAARLFTLADEGKIRIYISSLSFANIHYLLSRELSPAEARKILRKFKLLVHISELNEKIIDLALNSDFSDFEDAIQYFTALQNDIDIILTRNIKHYKKTRVTVLTAQDYINL